MKSGGVMVNQAAQSAIRYGGLAASLSLGMLCGLVGAGYLSFELHSPPSTFAYIIALLWVGVGALQYYAFSLNRMSIIIRLAAYYLLSIITIIFITGISSATITPYGILLALSTYAYFKRNGLIASLLILWLAALADILINGASIPILTAAASTGIAITVVTSVLASITSSSGKSDKEVATSKLEAKLQQESLETLVNNINDAVLSTDKSGVIRIYNAAAVGLLDTNKTLTGSSIDDVIALYDESDKPISFSSLLAAASSLVVNESLRTTIAGEELRLGITYSPIRSAYTSARTAPNKNGYIIILRDITKAKSLEEERDEFISVVSHELRTPITIAEGAIDNAQIIFAKDPSKKALVSKSLTVAHDQTLFLSRMINDLSTLSRAERGIADEPETIDVKDLMLSLKNEYAPQAAKKSLTFDLEIKGSLGHVHVSHLYLRELLQNFITNAIKYTKAGTVTLDVSATTTTVTFVVRDTGIGISKGDQQKIFKKFYRSEDYRTRETGGTGLGLYVAIKLAKKLHTKIEITSRLNHGSSFSFTLPKTSK